jgi:hypothetical protein
MKFLKTCIVLHVMGVNDGGETNWQKKWWKQNSRQGWHGKGKRSQISKYRQIGGSCTSSEKEINRMSITECNEYPHDAVLDVKIDYIGKAVDEIKLKVDSNSLGVIWLKAIIYILTPINLLLIGTLARVALAK